MKVAPPTAPPSPDTPARRAVPWRRRLPGARVLRDGSVIYWWVEIAFIAGYYAVYSTIRNLNGGDTNVARHHAMQILGFQAHLSLNIEHQLQQWALHFTPFIDASNYFYGSLHFVVTAFALFYLFTRWRDDYPLWRNAMAVATGLALLGFIFFPLMPPRLLPAHYGYVDTLAKYPTFWSFKSGAINKISNQYAAMPSVHCAWALFCACALVPRVKHTWAKVLAGIYPVFTVTAIVVTANHYIVDAFAGFVALGIGYLVSRLCTRAGRRPVDAAPAT